MKLYLYCLIGDDAPTESLVFSGENEGVSGSPVTRFCLGDFNLLVSDFAGSSVPLTRDNVLKHAAVVNRILTETTPLPFRFGTLATEQELESFLNSRSEALKVKLELVRGCVEMSVKIISERESAEPPVPSNEDEQKPGTAFLREKRREILGSEARVSEAKTTADWLSKRLGDSVRRSQINTNATDKLILAAAHLVEWSTVEQYRAKLKQVQLERPELHFLVSGPWPPYSFADIDLEFKTQFGVS